MFIEQVKKAMGNFCPLNYVKTRLPEILSSILGKAILVFLTEGKEEQYFWAQKLRGTASKTN